MSVRREGPPSGPQAPSPGQFGGGRGWGPAGFPGAPRRGPSLRKESRSPRRRDLARPHPGQRSCSSLDARVRTKPGEGPGAKSWRFCPRKWPLQPAELALEDFCPRVPDTSAFPVLAPDKCTGLQSPDPGLVHSPFPILPYSEGRAKREAPASLPAGEGDSAPSRTGLQLPLTLPTESRRQQNPLKGTKTMRAEWGASLRRTRGGR